MDDLPLVRRRQPSGPLGYLNYPSEILNIIYQKLFVNDSEILVFLCSSDPQLNDIGLKCSTGIPPKTAKGGISWSHLLDDQYFVESNGRSAQFLRVCKQVWLEGSPVLYGNLNIAMRWIPWKEPCVDNFFRRNSDFIRAWAKVIVPEYHKLRQRKNRGVGWELDCMMRWWATHDEYFWQQDLPIRTKVGGYGLTT